MSQQLAPCPRFLFGCVCSREDAPPRHRVEPFAVLKDPISTFARLKDLVAKMPRTVMVTATDTYLHATCRTRLGFVDNLECRLCSAKRVIHARSSSRLAIWDLGANRKRVKNLWQQLQNGS